MMKPGMEFDFDVEIVFGKRKARDEKVTRKMKKEGKGRMRERTRKKIERKKETKKQRNEGEGRQPVEGC